MKKRNQSTRTINTKEFIVYIAFLAIFIFFSIILRGRGFLSSENLMNIARQTAMISVMAVGMTFVLAAGEIDLSIGSIAVSYTHLLF